MSQGQTASTRLSVAERSYPAAWRTSIRCSLCGETSEMVTNFRPASVECPSCGLVTSFDPQKEPLGVRGLRLRFDKVDNGMHRMKPVDAVPNGTLDEAAYDRPRRWTPLGVAAVVLMAVAMVGLAVVAVVWKVPAR